MVRDNFRIWKDTNNPEYPYVLRWDEVNYVTGESDHYDAPIDVPANCSFGELYHELRRYHDIEPTEVEYLDGCGDDFCDV